MICKLIYALIQMFMIFCLLLSPQVMAISAAVASSYVYDNNIYRTKNGEVTDYIMIVLPSIRSELEYQKYIRVVSYIPHTPSFLVSHQRNLRQACIYH